jgi:hypothetical protein
MRMIVDRANRRDVGHQRRVDRHLIVRHSTGNGRIAAPTNAAGRDGHDRDCCHQEQLRNVTTHTG